MNASQDETVAYHNASPRAWVKMLEEIARNILPSTVHTYLPLNGRVIHYHHCPECHEVYECNMPCSIEPHLSDPVNHPDKQFGAHCKCFDCAGAGVEFDKVFWDRYHGFAHT